ncbi:uroporphyrinogen-III C-methyltransferase [Pedococcus bigeumensis]|uniref:uroporphyrinogen-III C-methyltransferase n=1 Tax=Pedococcus bigeumensis TaxID=433644 RepID=A0A502CXC1_9MICO|nr:uroporphyrinogen-III C-methyltransferase [Pedococcus bigeumensis]TPG17917.1 uroporphyrinogen-III C-methyltransferase [Pedococcus bigeumensis]
MTSPAYPLTLDLAGRRVVVVGGGPVAARRAAGLVDAGALVDLVAPFVCEDLATLATTGMISWVRRDYLPGDLTLKDRGGPDPDDLSNSQAEGVLDPAWLVHTATGDPLVDAQVAREADAARIWCVRADAADASSAWTPAVARGADGTASEGLTVAVTAGGDPRRATAVRDAVLAALDSGTLPVRRVRREATPQGTATPVGGVALVGGGPGADDLITVRGRALLAAADVIVTDRLGPRGLLQTVGADVEVIDVGKTPGNHPVSQERINELLVHHALLGKRVVRLKGGDPFVLGRGGEEALHCLEHGVPVEVVPGVTSAVSVPAAAGIPVTHRGIAASFVVASAHEGAEHVLAAAADAAPDATLVLLMGVTRLAETAAALIASGRPADTPVALVERGWTPEQRTTTTTLLHAARDAAATGVQSPAVVVVGQVVNLRERLGDLSGVASRE